MQHRMLLIVLLMMSAMGYGEEPKKPHQIDTVKPSLKVALHALETSIGMLLLGLGTYGITSLGYDRYKTGEWNEETVPVLLGTWPKNADYAENVTAYFLLGASLPKIAVGAGLTAHGFMNLYRDLNIPAQIEKVLRLLKKEKNNNRDD